MRSLQDYIDIYRNIATKLNLQGDSVEVLAQMLANATYISEVENIAYVQESSLEKSTLLNSKIQHCVDEMYSVFRGSCPRVVINFKPNKYFNFNVFDEIVSLNSFKVYYLGYYENSNTNLNTTGTSAVSEIPEFIYAPITIPPTTDDKVYTIIGLLAKEVVNESWVLNQNNTYYVDCLENDLSNDIWVKINSDYFDVTREFSTHILDNKIFDLTLPNFGSRLYVADIFRSVFNREEIPTPVNTTVDAQYYKYSLFEDYNTSDLSRINIKGTELIPFTTEQESLFSELIDIVPGVYAIKESARTTSPTIHYKANRDRYVNSILRSNSDIGVVLEEFYPEKIILGGTSYVFNVTSDNSILDIYYVPQNNSNLLTNEEIQEFIDKRTAYYITNQINIQRGNQYTANFNLNVELYQSNSISSEVEDILVAYQNKFNINFENSLEEIRTLISKISNVKQIISLNITYTNEDGISLSDMSGIDPTTSYYQINYVINSTTQTLRF